MPLLLLAYLGFVSLGLPDGMLGVAWPHMRAEFGVPVGAVGFLLAVGTAGYLLSSVGAGFTLDRLGVGWLLAISTILTASALAGYGLAPVLAVTVATSLLLGLGSGAIDAGMNAYAARHFSARHMNWLHAGFGFGATLGPLVVTGVLVTGLVWRWAYAVVAAAQALLAVAFLSHVRSWADDLARPGAGAAAERPGRPSVRESLVLPGMWRGATAFAIEVAIEIGAALWAYTLLTEGRGMSEEVAGLAVSGYWGAMFAGRIGYGALGSRLDPHRVMTASMVGLVVGALLVALPAPGWLAVVGLLVLGLSAAPLFPLLMLTTSERVGDRHADRAVGLQAAAACLGGTAVPAGIGALIGWYGPELLGPVLVGLAMALVGLYLTFPRHQPASGPPTTLTHP